MARFCRKCGVKNEDIRKFCTACGQSMVPPVAVDPVKEPALPVVEESQAVNNNQPPLPEIVPVELPLAAAIKITEPIPEFIPPSDPIVEQSQLVQEVQAATPEVVLVETPKPVLLEEQVPVEEVKLEVKVVPPVLEPVVSETPIVPAPITLPPVTSQVAKASKKLNKLVFIIAGVALLLIGVGVWAYLQHQAKLAKPAEVITSPAASTDAEGEQSPKPLPAIDVSKPAVVTPPPAEVKEPEPKPLPANIGAEEKPAITNPIAVKPAVIKPTVAKPVAAKPKKVKKVIEETPVETKPQETNEAEPADSSTQSSAETTSTSSQNEGNSEAPPAEKEKKTRGLFRKLFKGMKESGGEVACTDAERAMNQCH